MRNIRSGLITAAAVGAAAIGGGAIANAANSSSTSTTTSTTPSTTSSSAPQAQPNFPGHGSAAHEDAEKPVTGTAATRAQTAAVKSLGGGKPGAVTTDFTGNGYEVTVTRSDGSTTEVHLDSSFNVIQGGPGGRGRPGGPSGYGG